MSRYLKVFLCFFSFLLILTNCKNKKWDEYYSRPDNLVPCIYQQLQSGKYGEFSLYLKIIDKSNFRKVLDRAGYYTLFAPTDDAVRLYLEQNYGGADRIDDLLKDSVKVNQLVAFNTVYNGYTIEQLASYQSKTGWQAGYAFKRRTALYKGAYYDSSYVSNIDLKGKNYLIVDCNRNEIDKYDVVTKSYEINDNSYKYVSYFTSQYFGTMALTEAAYDYTQMYSNEYIGANIADAKITGQDIPAENGYIQVTDRVVEPMLNLDEYISKPQFSKFKQLLDTFAIFTYNSDKSTRVQKVKGLVERPYVVVKRYDIDKIKTANPVLKNEKLLERIPYSPNNECWKKSEDNDAQKNGWTLIAPNNDAMDVFLNNVLLHKSGTKRYKSLSTVPIAAIRDFVATHMGEVVVWPEKFSNFKDAPSKSNVYLKKMASNGIFYASSQVAPSRRLYSIFGELYLNPDLYFQYKLMTNTSLGLVTTITDPNKSFASIVYPDSYFAYFGCTFSENTNVFSFPSSFLRKAMAPLGNNRAEFLNLNILEIKASVKDLFDIPTRSFSEYHKDENLTVTGSITDRIVKTLDENYVICRKNDPILVENKETYTNIIFSAGNTDTLCNEGDVWAVRVGKPILASSGIGVTYQAVDSIETSKYCMLRSAIYNLPSSTDRSFQYRSKEGLLIKKYFYDFPRQRELTTVKYYGGLIKDASKYSLTTSNTDFSTPYQYRNNYYPNFWPWKKDSLFFAYLYSCSADFYQKQDGVITYMDNRSTCMTVLLPRGDSLINLIDRPNMFFPNVPEEKRLLPRLSWDPYYSTDWTDNDVYRVQAFVAYHIIKKGIVNDGVENELEYETCLPYKFIYDYISAKDEYYKAGGVTVKLVTGSNVEYGTLKFQDASGRIYPVVTHNSNILGHRMVIHQLDGCLNYNY